MTSYFTFEDECSKGGEYCQAPKRFLVNSMIMIKFGLLRGSYNLYMAPQVVKTWENSKSKLDP